MSDAKATGRVSAAVMLSRILGLVREMVFAGLFGGSRWVDGFYLAFRVPNLLRDLFAEGALSQAFVTVFSKKVKADGPDAAWPLANQMLTLAAVFMSAITVLGIVLAPWLVDLLTAFSRSGAGPREYDPGEIAFIVTMVRIMYPFILLVSLSALVMGMLNARGVFGMPALASCFFNLGSMLGGVGIGWWLDPAWGPRSLLGFSIGVLIGGLAQLMVQFPALRRVGFRFRPTFNWRGEGVQKILKLMGPAVIAASAVQINVVVNSMFAYGVAEGAVSWLSWAFRLMQLPLGVFGVAVATVTLPALARAATGGIGTDFGATLGRGLRLVGFLVLPCTIGLVILAEPVITLLYERGSFNAYDRTQTAAALQAYAFGLLFYSWIKVLQPAFYAIDRRWVPMLVSFSSVVVNALFNWFFIFRMELGHEYLALSTSLVATINFVLLYLLMGKHTGLETGRLVIALGKTVVAGAAMGGFLWWARGAYLGHLEESNTLVRSMFVLPVVGLGAALYFGLCQLLRLPEAGDFVAIFRKRLGR
jgi:putative peptidoglycan lipid II flippase